MVLDSMSLCYSWVATWVVEKLWRFAVAIYISIPQRGMVSEFVMEGSRVLLTNERRG